MVAIESKDFEGLLNRLEYIVREKVRPSLNEDIKKEGEPGRWSETLQQRSMMAQDMENLVVAGNALIKEHAKVLIEVSNFVEQMNANVMINNNAIPTELFREQALLFNKQYEVLTKRYEKTGKDYFTNDK